MRSSRRGNTRIAIVVRAVLTEERLGKAFRDRTRPGLVSFVLHLSVRSSVGSSRQWYGDNSTPRDIGQTFNLRVNCEFFAHGYTHFAVFSQAWSRTNGITTRRTSPRWTWPRRWWKPTRRTATTKTRNGRASRRRAPRACPRRPRRPPRETSRPTRPTTRGNRSAQ